MSAPTRAATAALLAAVLASPARAQTQTPSGKYVIDPATADEKLEPVYQPALRPAPRRGIGFDVGLGSFGGFCDGCPDLLGGLSVDAFAGAQLTCRVALLAELWGIGHLLAPDDGAGLVAHVFASAAARVWVTPVLWLQGSAGGAMFGYQRDGEEDYALFGPALGLAVGGETGHQPRSGVDVSLRLGGALYDDQGDRVVLYSVAGQIGWHWN